MSIDDTPSEERIIEALQTAVSTETRDRKEALAIYVESIGPRLARHFDHNSALDSGDVRGVVNALAISARLSVRAQEIFGLIIRGESVDKLIEDLEAAVKDAPIVVRIPT